MSDSKVYMYPESTSQIDPNLMMALNQNGGFGGNGNWLWIFFLFFLWPLMRGNNMFGGSDLSSQINNDAGRQLLMSAIQGNGNAISNLASNLNTDVDSIKTSIGGVMQSIQSVAGQIGLTSNQVINSIQAGNASLGQLVAQCCCENRLAIANQTAQLLQDSCSRTQSVINSVNQGFNGIYNQLNNNHTASTIQVNSLQNDLDKNFSVLAYENQGNAQNIKDAASANTQAIIAKLDAIQTTALQDKIASLQELKNSLSNQLSNEHQTIAFNLSIAAAVTPINSALNYLQTEVSDIKCKMPNTVTTPYSPFVAVPNSVAWNLYGNSIWS